MIKDILVKQMSKEQISEYKKAFYLINKSKDGIIKLNEIEKILEIFSQDKSQAKIIFDKYNKSLDNGINFNDFLNLITDKLYDTEFNDAIDLLFELFSINNEITKESLRASLIEFKNNLNKNKMLIEVQNTIEKISKYSNSMNILINFFTSIKNTEIDVNFIDELIKEGDTDNKGYMTKQDLINCFIK